MAKNANTLKTVFGGCFSSAEDLKDDVMYIPWRGARTLPQAHTNVSFFFSLIMRIFKINIYLFGCTRSLMWHVGSLVVYVCVCARMHSVVSNSATPWTVARQAPLSTGFSRQEYWSRMSFPSPEDLSDPGIEPVSLVSPALAGGFFTFWTILVACRLLVEACELLVAACGI